MNRKLVMEGIPNNAVLTRQDILRIACQIDNSFRETLFRNLLEDLLQEGSIIRVGRNRYQKSIPGVEKVMYLNQYSEDAQKLIDEMTEKYPLIDYRVWEINWLNEFWNHQIAQNKIFLEVENIGCEFVYTELCERYPGKILLRPDENELYRYGRQNTIIVDRLISETPKGSPYSYNTPLEKIVVDLFASRNLKSMVHIGEYAKAISDMFGKYQIDQVKLFRYAKRRNKKSEIYNFLKDETRVELYVEE
ncbi:MAG: DUF6577 family protein [Clostridium sp.]